MLQKQSIRCGDGSKKNRKKAPRKQHLYSGLMEHFVGSCLGTRIQLFVDGTSLVEWPNSKATPPIDTAASNGHFWVVEWLHSNNCKSNGCTTDALDHAAGSGHLPIVQFLHSNRTEGCTPKALNRASENDTSPWWNGCKKIARTLA